MKNIKIINWWSGGVVSNSYYTTLLARATTLGYTQPTAQATAQITLANKIDFSLYDVIHLFTVNNVAADNFSKLNWKTPASNEVTLTAGTAIPTYGTTGWNSGTGTGYMSSNYNPTTQASAWVDANSCSISAWIVQYPSNQADIVSTNGGGGGRNWIARNNSTSSYMNVHYTTDTSYTTGTEAAYDYLTVSVYGGNYYIFKNGAQKATGAATVGASPNFAIAYFRLLQIAHPTSCILGAVLMGAGITLAQHTTVYNGLVTYKTAIGL